MRELNVCICAYPSRYVTKSLSHSARWALTLSSTPGTSPSPWRATADARACAGPATAASRHTADNAASRGTKKKAIFE